MNDSIASRIGRIIAGTAHSIVSKIEGLSKESVLEQALKELDGALNEVKAELGLVNAQKYQVSKSMTRLNNEHSILDEQVADAYKAGRMDLVESALARQTDIEDQLPALEAQLGRLSEQEKEHSQAITGLVAKRNEIEDELCEAHLASTNHADDELEADGEILRKAEDTKDTVSRVVNRTSGLKRNGSFGPSDGESAKLVELANLGRKAKIEAKLRVLEERMSLEGDDD